MNEKNEDIKEKHEDIKGKNEDMYPFILEKDEKLILITISSRDEKLHYSLICKNNNTINDVEKEFYKAFPEYAKTKNIFIYKGKIITKFETLQKNHIKNGDILILDRIDS